MQHVSRAIKGLVWARRKQDKATLKDVSVDVQAIKDFLRANIGTNYIAATRPSDANQLNVDMADWGGLRTPRSSAPFNQIRNAQQGIRDYVQRQLTKLCPWQRWQ